MRGSDMNPLSGILDEVLRRTDVAEAAHEARAVMLWPEIVGPQMARASEAVKVQAGTLVVVTRSSSWSQEFSFQKETILRKYRERLGRGVVKDLRFTVGSVRGISPQAYPQGPSTEELLHIRLSEEEVQRIQEAATSDDPELGQAICRALTREAQLRQWHLQHGARPCPRCGAAYRTVHDLCPACRQDDTTQSQLAQGRNAAEAD